MKKLFYILFVSLFIFSCDGVGNNLSGPLCSEGLIEIGGECVDQCGNVEGDHLNSDGYHCGDLNILEEFINLTNYSGDVLGFGNQTWNEGRLVSLDLSDNWSGGQNISGQIPESIGDLTNLTTFIIRNQFGFTQEERFFGIIPESICTIDNLEYLSMCSSGQGGGGCSSFDSFSFFTYNDFCPPYPTCLNTPKHIGYQNTDECEDFQCDYNQVKLSNYCLDETTTNFNFRYQEHIGEVPSEFWSLLNLNEYSLSNNQFTGIISEEVCNVNSHNYPIGYDPRTGQIFYELSLTNNKFCPPYPECIQDYIGTQDTSNCP